MIGRDPRPPSHAIRAHARARAAGTNPAVLGGPGGVSFKVWAHAHGYAVRREPEHLAGDTRGWCVPLNRCRGWLWNAGASVGVHYVGTPRQAGPALDALGGLPGWRLQTDAADGFLGWVGWSAWSPAFAAVLRPRRSRRRPRQGPKARLGGGAGPVRPSGWPSGRPKGREAGTPPNSAGPSGAALVEPRPTEPDA